jgi:two-component system, OmpR family, response regulator
MKLLIIEDEAKLARLLVRGLGEAGHQVDACADGETGSQQAESIAYDCIVLDWSLPDTDGVTLLRRWRDRGLSTPVLMLTARGTVGERIVGLRAGADDYLPKPFDFGELLARLEALHRRGGGHLPVRQLGALRVDSNRRVLIREGKEETLTGREFALFHELAGHAGETLTRSELLTRVWGSLFDGTPNVIDVYVGYLRAKLTRLHAADVAIEAVRGVGFRLTVVSGQQDG